MVKMFMRFPEGKAKALTLSYDDGVEQDIRLIDILNKHGIKATFNINSGVYAAEDKVYPEGTIHRRMSKSCVIKTYKDSPHEVAVHSYTHPYLDHIPSVGVVNQVLSDRLELEKDFGGIIRGMAYPMGTFNDETVAALAACGIAYSRTTVSTGKFDIPKDWLRLPATCHHNDPKLMELAKKFLDNKREPASLFYLWGHSYEFESNDNWNVIEEFCEYMGGKEDVWYATNIEIYDYIESYKRLVWSADCKTVYNPSAIPLWFKFNIHGEPSKIVKIESGESLAL